MCYEWCLDEFRVDLLQQAKDEETKHGQDTIHKAAAAALAKACGSSGKQTPIGQVVVVL